MSTGRLSAEDWAAAALDAVAAGGLAAVAIEPLARTLGVTKGSFYWHFKSRDELVAAAIARWEELHRAAPVGDADAGDTEARLAEVARDALRFALKPSVHARLVHEADDPRVAAALARVSRRRVEQLSGLYVRSGLSPDDARLRAATSYAAVLGLAQLHEQGVLDAGDTAALERALRAALTPVP